ncbi:MAG: AI-2E family transporter [Salinisphaera sp.]|jgi:predicted PurR-regulated permease PerM|nr:AI-2E family transporter [Salinisphaera sp.]
MVFSPVRRFFDRRGVPQGLSALGIVSVILIIFFSIAAALAVPISSWTNNSSRLESTVEYRLSGISGPFSDYFAAPSSPDPNSSSSNGPSSKKESNAAQTSMSVAESIASQLPSVVAQFVFTLVLLLFLLASGDMFYEKIVQVMPTLHDKKRAVKIAHDIERKLSRYLLTITIINAGLGVAVGIAMWALGLPNALMFGIIAFLFNFVPYLGAFVGILIAALVALVAFSWAGWALIVAGVYLSLTTLEGQFVTPYFIGRSLRLNTVAVFVTISFWAWLWSAVGMIVAVPLLVAIKTFGEHIDALKSLSHFLAERHEKFEGMLETSDSDSSKPDKAE